MVSQRFKSRVDHYRGITNVNNPPSRISDPWIFHRCLLFQKILAIFFLALIILKKFPPAVGSYYYIFSEAQIWTLRGSIFWQILRFCLKIPLKNFRLRRAGPLRRLLFQKKIPPPAGPSCPLYTSPTPQNLLTPRIPPLASKKKNSTCHVPVYSFDLSQYTL